MAVRKSPQVTPALDSSQADNTDRRVVALSDGGFNSIIRLINRGTIDRVLTIRTATFHTLKRLRVKRDLSKAVKRTPKGSDQGDIGTLGRWLDSVQRNDKKAVRQIVAIDATCCARGT